MPESKAEQLGAIRKKLVEKFGSRLKGVVAPEAQLAMAEAPSPEPPPPKPPPEAELEQMPEKQPRHYVTKFVKATDEKGELVSPEPVMITNVSTDRQGNYHYDFVDIDGKHDDVPESQTEEVSPEEAEAAKEKFEARALRIEEETKPREAAASAAEQRPEEQSASPEVLKEAMAEEVKQTFEERLKAANLSAEERTRLEKIVNNKDLLEKVTGTALEKLSKWKVLGIRADAIADFTASFAGGMAIRSAMRQSLEAMFSLGTLGIGTAGGAAVGLFFRGFREWRKARREQYGAGSWLKELEGKDGIELARSHQALSLAIDRAKVKGDKEEALALVLKLRDIETKIGLSRDQKPQSMQEQLRQVLEVRGRSFGATDFVGEHERLYQDMLRTRKKEIFWKFAKGAGKGALIGAAGGFLGSMVAEQLGWGSDKTAEEISKQIVEAKQQAMIENVHGAAKELPSKLFTSTFTSYAEAGEGLSHMARNLIHDYITEQDALQPDKPLELTREQLVYAEDLLRRQFEDIAVSPGEAFQLKGEKIVEAIKNAVKLGQEGKLENLKENWVGKISEKTWVEITDYSKTFERVNDFAAAAKQQAIAAADAIDQTAARPFSTEQLTGEFKKYTEDNKDTLKIVGYVTSVVLATGAYPAVDAIRHRVKEKRQRFEQGQIKELTAQLNKKYGIFTASSGGGEDYIGLQNLDKALASLPAEVKHNLRGKKFRPGKENVLTRDAVISFDSSSKADDLAKFVAYTLPEAERRMQVNKEAVSLRAELHEEYGIEIRSYAYGDEHLKAVETLEQALEDYEKFPKKIRINLLDAGLPEPEEGLNLRVHMTAEEMEGAINNYLKSAQAKAA